MLYVALLLAKLQVVLGNPPSPMMEEALMATPFGVVMAGKETASKGPSLNEHEVKLAYGMGEWTSQVTKMLHDDASEERERET